ncbi:DUF1758 domain-containing protein [Trichonephila clavipes]|nr:DUF1758 domain-containing protein [Trichonephila clavipes]
MSFVISLLKEDETDQAIEEPDEIMHINRDSEKECFQWLKIAFGDEFPCRAAVFRWFKEFCSSRNSLQDEEHTRKPRWLNVKSSITKLQNKTEEEIEKLNNVGLLARKNRFLEFRTEIKNILNSIIREIESICEEKDEETYCTEKDDILDTLEEILVAIDTQLMPSVVNSDFDVKNQGSSHSLVSTRSAEVKLPTLFLPIFSGVTEEWLAFSDLFEAAVSNNNDLTGAQKLQYLKDQFKIRCIKNH